MFKKIWVVECEKCGKVEPVIRNLFDREYLIRYFSDCANDYRYSSIPGYHLWSITDDCTLCPECNETFKLAKKLLELPADKFNKLNILVDDINKNRV